MAERSVEIGEHVKLLPCVPEWRLREEASDHQRPCPRVELDPENGLASRLVLSSIQEHRRHLVGPALVAAGLEGDEAESVLIRVERALESPALLRKMFPSLDKEHRDGGHPAPPPPSPRARAAGFRPARARVVRFPGRSLRRG